MTINAAGLINDLMILYVEDKHTYINLSGYEDTALIALYFISVNECRVINWYYLNAFEKVKDAVIKECAFRYVKEKSNVHDN